LAPAVRGDKTLVELAEPVQGPSEPDRQWPRGAAGARLPRLFAERPGDQAGPGPDLKTLHAKIGELALANDFLSNALVAIGDASAKRLIDPAHPAAIVAAGRNWLELSRASSTTARSRPRTPDLALMRRIDELHLGKRQPEPVLTVRA